MFTEAQVSQWQSDIYGLLDTPIPLAQWLRAQGSRVVGRGHHINACPIHNFLSDKAPWLDAHIGMCHISCDLSDALCSQHGWLTDAHQWNGSSRLDYYGGYAQKLVPDWLGKFIWTFDHQYCMKVQACRLYDRVQEDRTYNSYATGLQALKVLAQAAPEILAVGWVGNDLQDCLQAAVNNRTEALF